MTNKEAQYTKYLNQNRIWKFPDWWEPINLVKSYWIREKLIFFSNQTYH